MKEKRKLSSGAKTGLAIAVILAVAAVAGIGIKAIFDNAAKEQAIDEKTALSFALQDAEISDEDILESAASFALENGQYMYDIRFTKDDTDYHYKISAGTGRVLSVEKLRTVPSPQKNTDGGTNLVFISEDKVKEIVLSDCGEADVTFEK